ncbi:MAG: phage tail sheath family protein [Actinobacteria bacterium]|nr:phage tail sheath family protein [Actinomycetota bacterium]
MAEFEHPGVFVEENPVGPAPIEGVETSTTGFVGAVENAERHAPFQVRSLADFERAFGPVESGFRLGLAVAHFFANGGDDAWIVGLPNGVPLSDGLARLDDVDTLSLLCVPGETDLDVLRAVVEYAERRRTFALIDPYGTDLPGTIALAEVLALTGSANGAVYFPSLLAADPAGVLRMCPPSGAVAGMLARLDRERGFWKAPAGENAVLHGVALALERSEEESSRLTSAAVNAIRRFPEEGVLVWGARRFRARSRVIPNGSTSRYDGWPSTSSTASTAALSGPSSSRTTSRRGRSCAGSAKSSSPGSSAREHCRAAQPTRPTSFAAGATR